MMLDRDAADCCNVGRRALLTGGSLMLATLASPALAASDGVVGMSRAERDAMSPDDVLKMVLEGNARFVAGEPTRRDWLGEQRATAAGQYPAAIFLSCVDSRVPVEVVCDLGIGEMFSARVAGNAVNDDILGSIEFATAAAGAKLVMVMGHSACGAIKGAIDGVRLGNLTLLLARFGNAIDETDYKGDRTAKNATFVDAVAKTHVKKTMRLMRERSPVLKDMEDKGRIRIAGAFYDLQSGRVELLA